MGAKTGDVCRGGGREDDEGERVVEVSPSSDPLIEAIVVVVEVIRILAAIATVAAAAVMSVLGIVVGSCRGGEITMAELLLLLFP